MQKQVKIIGLSLTKDFGALKATSLFFDEENRLKIFKGEVGAGKTSLHKAMKLTTAGTKTLEDKNLYGDIDVVTQLLDGDKNIFVGCRTKSDGNSLDYFLYSLDENGKKINDVVLDGVKATPSSYLKSLQTELTWRLNEFTSENTTVVRQILLELYQEEMEEKGVIFEKSHPKYVGGIIDKIEKAKNKRNDLDAIRKTVGGIADDLRKKGVDFENRRVLKETVLAKKLVNDLVAEITILKSNPEVTKQSQLTELKLKGSNSNTALRNKNDSIKESNKIISSELEVYDSKLESINNSLQLAKDHLQNVVFDNEFFVQTLWDTEVIPSVKYPDKIDKKLSKEIQFNQQGSCISATEEEIKTFEDPEVISLLKNYAEAVNNYVLANSKPAEEVDTKEKESELKQAEKALKDIEDINSEVAAVNAFHDWSDQNSVVSNLKKDYFNKLNGIPTGVDGLFIAPEFIVNAEGEKVAKDDADIFLWYNGSYDPEYFSNPNKDLRKLASYSDTQKPMICLLIQRYLLSKKSKSLPYLWIDQVPIDLKTKALLDKMAEELGLYLFVNWTGDFEVNALKDGEILIENGEIFQKPE